MYIVTLFSGSGRDSNQWSI